MSKLVLGFGLGFYLTIGPMMTSELTPVVLRGMATAGVNLGIAIGQLLSNSVVAGFGQRTDRWAYRAPFALQLAFVIILLLGLWSAPESPVYLCKKGRTADAEKVLRQIWGDKIDVSAKMTALRETIAEETAGKGEVSLVDCFRGTNLTRSVISMGVFVCQHAVGIIFVLGFSSCKAHSNLLCSCPNWNLRLLPACRSRRFQILRPRSGRHRLRSSRQLGQLVRHQQSRPTSHVRLGYGGAVGDADSHWHPGPRANWWGKVGASRYHCRLGLCLREYT